jgi:hypothetical protein
MNAAIEPVFFGLLLSWIAAAYSVALYGLWKLGEDSGKRGLARIWAGSMLTYDVFVSELQARLQKRNRRVE